jgi:hypothetical protein
LGDGTFPKAFVSVELAARFFKKVGGDVGGHFGLPDQWI